ncbi:pyridoxal phosphate-dependent aminotransferase [Lacticaseibacillus saniviri]|uniref:pyridoxal phosphate-dependent aminotransferase n=1 Tax=Lacticaseibacillus saniviri TaxID=931533 RepID=UPI001EDF2394|nr:pyridoxal phosphate-dependent aminotransferase [Lacticaseibacillus saniviri]MCG4282385.1 pyridoxal phosphate-dependent aminotransferase [Lacticaseibacillus saniviri]
MHLAKRVSKLQPSATLALSRQAQQLAQSGQDVIDLSIGQPDFTTPRVIKDAAISAINDGSASFYTPANGLPALREAISQHIYQQNGVTYSPDQIAVTNGAKYALASVFNLILNAGDNVLIPVPYWVSYVEQVRLAEGEPILVPSQSGFKVTVDELEAARTDKTRAIILNSPQNPTGVVYSKQELTLIGNWAVQHQILIIADDIYRDLVYNGTNFTSMISIDPAITANTILISGVSKTYAMTGWRIGYVAGPAKFMQTFSAYLSHTTGNPATVSQYAAIAAYTVDQGIVETMRQAFETRLNRLYPLIAAIPGFDLDEKPTGAFYLFPKIKRTVELLNYATTDDFAAALLAETGVAIVPGRAFGIPEYARISYAKDLESLEEAANRMQAFVTKTMI